jgi:acetoin utilization deacetylase AcuC-like enzyme
VSKVEHFAPTWILVSAGFDGHRRDPLSQLGLAAGDYGDLAKRLAALVPAGRLVAFLEGGYHLDALAASVATTIGALAGSPVDIEPASSGGRAEDVVAAVQAQHGLG